MRAEMLLIFFLASFVRAQDSQFFFDPNGNLLVQTGPPTAPPQIIGQPQNDVVAPGDSASFFVVAVVDARWVRAEGTHRFFRGHEAQRGGDATKGARGFLQTPLIPATVIRSKVWRIVHQTELCPQSSTAGGTRPS
jgi:hypothetical protein